MTLLHHPWVCMYPQGFTSTQHRGIFPSALIASLVTARSFGTNLRVQHIRPTAYPCPRHKRVVRQQENRYNRDRWIRLISEVQVCSLICGSQILHSTQTIHACVYDEETNCLEIKGSKRGAGCLTKFQVINGLTCRYLKSQPILSYNCITNKSLCREPDR